MLVSIHIPFSQTAWARRFVETGELDDERVVVVNTDELNEPQREHLLRMLGCVGEPVIPIYGASRSVPLSNVWLTTYEPVPNIARILRRVYYLDFSRPGDALLLNAISDGAPKNELVQLALAGDAERWRVALATVRGAT